MKDLPSGKRVLSNCVTFGSIWCLGSDLFLGYDFRTGSERYDATTSACSSYVTTHFGNGRSTLATCASHHDNETVDFRTSESGGHSAPASPSSSLGRSNSLISFWSQMKQKLCPKGQRDKPIALRVDANKV